MTPSGPRRDAPIAKSLAVVLLPTAAFISLFNVAQRVANAGGQRAEVLLQASSATVLTALGIVAILALAGYQIGSANRTVRLLHPDSIVFTIICSPLVSARLEELGPVAALPAELRRWRGNLTFAVDHDRAQVYAGRWTVRHRFTIDMRECASSSGGRSTTTDFRTPPSVLLSFRRNDRTVGLPLPVKITRAGIARSADPAQVKRLAETIASQLNIPSR